MWPGESNKINYEHLPPTDNICLNCGSSGFGVINA